ncbi:nucleotidyltransferase family protein [Hoeflea poritis]|uniref:Nucleotidyltransferase family protein n=1 Tax=Hoeflea poritis TaxID=2993659 RepID=A0ABT4VRK8_9HYPH|nr:nucleotidyltransferase family protein [Hoeflea poritis]MDA4847239.1 nucleotidyltransferase family protein [Hoeflea poritis]
MKSAARNIDAVLLAAGLSRRMGAENKLLLRYQGRPLVRHTAATLIKARFRRLLVVTGHDAMRIEGALAGLAVTTSRNPHYRKGQMSSVVHGLRALMPGMGKNTPADGIMIALADMPYLTAADYRDLARAFREDGCEHIIVPEFLGQRGNPIVLPPRLAAVASNGDLNTGCRRLIENRPGDVRTVEARNSAFVRDIDTATDYGHAVRSSYLAAPCCG